MTSFTEFVETLRRNSVSSIGIEFHPPQTVVAGENDTVLQFFGKSIELPGIKACMINFFPPQTSGEPTPAGKKTPQEPIAAPMPPVVPAPAVPVRTTSQPAKTEKQPEPENRDEAVKPTVPEKHAEPEKKAESAAAAETPKRESKKAKAEAVAAAPEHRPEPQAAALPKPADVYDVFVETVEQDDGTKSDVKRALIGRMTLDDMLRVNAGFQLGLDTDVATEALRAELLTCFI